MCQTFIILLRAGPQNNVRLKPVRSAKKFADPLPRSTFTLFCDDDLFSSLILAFVFLSECQE